MFLKKNTQKSLTTPSPTTQTKLSASDTNPNLLRSILRENSKSAEIEKSVADKTDKEDDDKKSVRFNMDTNPDLTCSLSDDNSASDNESKHLEDKGNDIICVKLINNKPRSEFSEEGKKKIVKPDPTDFIMPDMTDSEEDSVFKSTNDKRLDDDKDSDTSSTIPEKVKPTEKESLMDIPSLITQGSVLEEDRKKDTYKKELSQALKSDLDKVLAAERLKHEAETKREIENLKKEMDIRCKETLNQERQKLEVRLDKQKMDLQEHFESEEQKWEKLQIERFDIKKKGLENIYEEKLAQVEKELLAKLDKSRDELIVSHNAVLDQMKQNHAKILNELQKDFKAEVMIIFLIIFKARVCCVSGRYYSEGASEANCRTQNQSIQRSRYREVFRSVNQGDL